MFIRIVFSTSLIIAYLVDKKETSGNFEVGEVRVDYHIYFDNGIETIDANEVYLGNYDGIDYYKNGVYEINLNDKTVLQYIHNLRIDFLVYSTVETYFRVIIYATPVMITTNIDGTVKTEYTVISEIPLKYASNWVEHKLKNKNFVFFKNKVIKPTDADYLLVPFINSYFETPYEEKKDYWLHLAIEVDAVQAHLGPQQNWALPYKPWEEGDEEW